MSVMEIIGKSTKRLSINSINSVRPNGCTPHTWWTNVFWLHPIITLALLPLTYTLRDYSFKYWIHPALAIEKEKLSNRPNHEGSIETKYVIFHLSCARIWLLRLLCDYIFVLQLHISCCVWPLQGFCR